MLHSRVLEHAQLGCLGLVLRIGPNDSGRKMFRSLCHRRMNVPGAPGRRVASRNPGVSNAGQRRRQGQRRSHWYVSTIAISETLYSPGGPVPSRDQPRCSAGSHLIDDS